MPDLSGTEALKQVDFALDAGNTVALLGANGSGKTTFALHLNGILRAKSALRMTVFLFFPQPVQPA